jgi:hypothetical protein
MIADIEREEQDYLKLRKQKVDIYQNALNAWKNGDVSVALSQMGLVLDLDRYAPIPLLPSSVVPIKASTTKSARSTTTLTTVTPKLADSG